DQLVLDDKGNLWVRRFVEQGTSPRYDIFTSNGEYLRSVILAFDAASYFVPTIVDGSVYGLALDTNDVPTVFRAAVPNLPQSQHYDLTACAWQRLTGTAAPYGR